MTGFTREEIAERGHSVWAEIDLGAIRDNIKTLRAVAGDAEVMGVVKGYAYGHGNPASARAMLQAGATRIGVARVAEAIHLRSAGIDAPIQVFTEPPPQSIATLLDLGVTPSVYTEPFARALSLEAAGRALRVGVHVKVDTGMHRVGLAIEAVDDALRVLAALPGLEVQGLWSHLAVADQPEHSFTRRQLDLFAEAAARVEAAGLGPVVKHIANSAATLSLPESHFDMVRCGIAAYGLSPGPAFDEVADLRPAFALKARIGMVKGLRAGEALSYGLRYRLPADSRVITVLAGYADGYDRRLSGRGRILVGGARRRVSGTVCMDQFMVDVGDAAVEVGDVATLIGRDGAEEVRAEEVADLIGTINYEVTARVPSRVPRVYIDEQPE